MKLLDNPPIEAFEYTRRNSTPELLERASTNLFVSERPVDCRLKKRIFFQANLYKVIHFRRRRFKFPEVHKSFMSSRIILVHQYNIKRSRIDLQIREDYANRNGGTSHTSAFRRQLQVVSFQVGLEVSREPTLQPTFTLPVTALLTGFRGGQSNEHEQEA